MLIIKSFLSANSKVFTVFNAVFVYSVTVSCVTITIAFVLAAMMNEVRPAVTCSLCTGVWVPSRPHKHDIDSDSEVSEALGAQPMMEDTLDDVAEPVCYRCGNSAHFSRTMEIAATQVISNNFLFTSCFL